MAEMMQMIFNLDVFMSNRFTGTFSRAQKVMSDLQKKMKPFENQQKIINNFKEQSQALTELVRQNNDTNWEDQSLLRQFTEQEKQVERLRKQLQGLGVDVSNLREHEKNLASQLGPAADAMKRLERAQANYENIMSKVSWSSLKGDVIAAAGALKIFQKPIKINMEFEQAMANVQAVMNLPKEEFKRLEKQAMELGAKTQFTNTQAANAQENLARAGFSVDEIINIMPNLLNLAAADNLGIDEAATIIGKTLRMYGMDSGQSAILTDLYAYTSANAMTDTRQLGAAMIEIASLAKNLNIDPEKMFGYLGGIANVSKDGGESGMAFLRSFERLMKDPKAVHKQLNALGIVTKGPNGEMRELPDLMRALDAKFTKMGIQSADRGGAMSKIFGQFSSPMTSFMNAVLSGDVDKLTLGLYTERDGKAQQMANIRNDTLKGDLTVLSSAWEGLMTNIGKGMEDFNRLVVQTLSKAVTFINELLEKMGPLKNYLITAAEIFAGMKIATSVGSFIINLIKLPAALHELRAAQSAVDTLTAVGSAAGGAAGGVRGLGSAFFALYGKVFLVIGAIQLLITYWDQIKALPGMIDNVMKSASVKESLGRNSTKGLEKGSADYHIAAMNSAFSAPSISARALGGLITRPEIALIGEAGPEAIIPLSPGKKTRGLQVLNYAAESLGVNLVPGNNNFQTLESGVNNTSINNISRNNNSLTRLMNESNNNALSTQNMYSALNNYSSVNTDTDNQNATSLLTQTESPSFTSINNSYANSVSNEGATNSQANFAPAINITVNATGSMSESEAQSLGENLYDKVREALSEIMENASRLSFA